MKGVGKDYEIIQGFDPFHLNIVYETQPPQRFVGNAKWLIAF